MLLPCFLSRRATQHTTAWSRPLTRSQGRAHWKRRVCLCVGVLAASCYPVPLSASPALVEQSSVVVEVVMGIHTYEEDPVTSPLGGVEPGLALGTIEEAKEGSTADESEGENTLEIPQDETTETPEKGDEEKKAEEKPIEDEDESNDEEDEEGEQPEVMVGALAYDWANHPDVDGGWAWVILFAMFGVFVITSGLLNTTGMYYVQMLSEYGYSRSYTAWMGSLINAFFMLGGPLSSMFIQSWGCRAALIFGSLLMSTGYLASAFTTSLEALFFTYGVVVACGMNFAYSGQIMALNQYFYKRHSIATSMAMLGIGLGIFFLSSVTEHNIEEYGWRGSFIWSAGLSLQIVVFGSLIFPLQPVPEGKMTQQPKENIPEPSRPLKAIRTSKSRMLLGKSLNHRSFSSLRLSAEASYLGHSQLSLMDSQRHLSNVRSNQHSFCSKGSHLVIGSIRSNGHSFCTRDSHAELSHFDLRSNQFSFHHKDSFAEFGLHSNAHSFCSRRDSQAGLNGIKSNPHSFIHHHHVLDGEGDSLKGSCGGGRARFMLREGDCDLGCCVLEEEDDCLSEQSAGEEHQSVCLVMAGKVKHKICNSLRGLTRKSEDNLCINARFWLLDLAFFFAMLGTMCLFIIYKDFAVSKNVGEYYTMGLSGIGIGDLVGRMSAGLMLSSEAPLWTVLAALMECWDSPQPTFLLALSSSSSASWSIVLLSGHRLYRYRCKTFTMVQYLIIFMFLVTLST
ncbi:uncharacterized protein LOC127003374 isoform X2 [Eriocheir sinensis]|uniref:uncharacterized protein LOC127003374 isoform X2 n=1 Tax=Eriocheir sinensis TaxID=95602 RepID=UPI0021C773EA|nr:uncharacterized protein LOC127003374 isoform X2 [Eriocheir sinensis]